MTILKTIPTMIKTKIQIMTFSLLRLETENRGELPFIPLVP